MPRYINVDDVTLKGLAVFDENLDLLVPLSDVRKALQMTPTADVVPKDNVYSILNEIEKTIRGALMLVDLSYKHNTREKQCKKECYEDFLGYIEELKKKYTEVDDG